MPVLKVNKITTFVKCGEAKLHFNDEGGSGDRKSRHVLGIEVVVEVNEERGLN